MKVEINRPLPGDRQMINDFFAKVVRDTFVKEGLGDDTGDINNEIRNKIAYLQKDYETGGRERFFLIAKDGDKIIGTIEYGPVSSLINKLTQDRYTDRVEIGTVFIDPDYQGRGIAALLLNCIYLIMQNNGITDFFLDSGYTIAKQIWRKKFGEPDYLFKDYWGEGYDHYIWKLKIADRIIQFHL